MTAWPKSGWTRAKASMMPTAPSGSGILGLPSRRRLGRLHREARAVLHQHVEIAEFGRLGSRRRGEAIERGQQMAQDANRQHAREVKARGLRPRYVGGDGAEVAMVQQEDERRRPAHHARLHHRAVLGVDDVAVVAGAGLAADRVAAAARAVPSSTTCASRPRATAAISGASTRVGGVSALASAPATFRVRVWHLMSR